MFVAQVNVGRVRGMLIRDRHPDDWRQRLLGQAVASMFAEMIHDREAPERRLLAWLLRAMLVERAVPPDGDFSWPIAFEVDVLDRIGPASGRNPRAGERAGRAGGVGAVRTMALPDTGNIESWVADLAAEARELGRRLHADFEDAVALLAGRSLAGESSQPAIDAATSGPMLPEREAREVRRRNAELEHELGRRQRRLDRRSVRLALAAADTLGRARRRVRGIGRRESS